MKKKVLAMAAALALLCTPCLADGLDYASMSDEELHAVVDGARNELASRELTMAGDTVLLDQDGVKVYLTGEKSISPFGSYTFLRLETIVVNDSDVNASVSIESASVNGWEISGTGITKTSAGKKQKGDLSFDIAPSGAQSLEEIEDLEITLRLSDSDTFRFYGDPVTITLHPAE